MHIYIYIYMHEELFSSVGITHQSKCRGCMANAKFKYLALWISAIVSQQASTIKTPGVCTATRQSPSCYDLKCS